MFTLSMIASMVTFGLSAFSPVQEDSINGNQNTD